MRALIAQRINNPILGPLGALNGSAFFGRLLPSLITLGFVIGSIIFIFYFLIGAIKWISSGGDKAKMQEAQSNITNALIGLVILFSLFGIISLIELFFGVDLTLFNLEQLRVGGGTSGPPIFACNPGQKICYDMNGNPFCAPAGPVCPI